MIRILLCMMTTSLLFPLAARAEAFLEAPLIPGGKTTSQTESRLEQSYEVSHDEALKFYQDQFAKEKDIKYRDRSDHSFIEEYGTRPWHSITITNKGSAEKKTQVIIMRDNWTWIMGTLTLRFTGVFAVLLVLYLAMEVSGAILARVGRPAETKD
ncbi:MAG: hypothetical protein AB1646_21265 [Thermodesulfobacteriota bacterium]